MTDKAVFIPDKLSEEALGLLRDAPGIEVDYRPGLTVEQKLEAVATASAIIGTLPTQLRAVTALLTASRLHGFTASRLYSHERRVSRGRRDVSREQ